MGRTAQGPTEALAEAAKACRIEGARHGLRTEGWEGPPYLVAHDAKRHLVRIRRRKRSRMLPDGSLGRLSGSGSSNRMQALGDRLCLAPDRSTIRPGLGRVLSAAGYGNPGDTAFAKRNGNCRRARSAYTPRRAFSVALPGLSDGTSNHRRNAVGGVEVRDSRPLAYALLDRLRDAHGLVAGRGAEVREPCERATRKTYRGEVRND